MLKRALKIVVLGAVGGTCVYSACIVFFLPGGSRAFLEKRTDFDQLFVYHVGEKYIDLSFKNLEGKPTVLSDYPHKVVLLNFFASWFGPCDAEASRMERAWKTYRAQRLVTVSIDVNESSGKAQAFRQKHHLTFPVLLVQDRVEGGFHVPFNLVIDEEGVVRYAGSGSEGHKMEDVIAGLLGLGAIEPAIAAAK